VAASPVSTRSGTPTRSCRRPRPEKLKNVSAHDSP
jgi:hypothetical protein